MASQTSLELSSHDHMAERMNFLGTVFSSLFYGIHVALFLSSLRPVFKRSRWLGAYSLALTVLATAGIILQTYWYSVAFLDHLKDPGGPYAFLRENVRHPVNIALTVIYLLMNWLADGIVLYRFYIIYSIMGMNSLITKIASVIMLLALIGTGSVYVPSIASLGSNLWTDISTAPGIAYLTLSLSLNTILTFLIVGRIILIGWHLRALGASHWRVYTSVITLLIESAALYTLWALISVIACGTNSRVQFALLPSLGQLQAVPPMLIIARVASGRALPSDHGASTVTKVRFSTNLSDTLPPYCTGEKGDYLRGRSPSFASSTYKPPLESFDDSYMARIADIEAARTFVPEVNSTKHEFALQSPIEPPSVYHAI